MVTREDDVVLSRMLAEVPRRLAYGVRCSLVPVRVVGCLLGRENLDEAAREAVQPVGVRDVPVERGRVELREYEDAADVSVQAPADRNVDQAVLAADRYRRFGSGGGQREKTRTLSAAEDDCE
jgi:hypothetical protein